MAKFCWQVPKRSLHTTSWTISIRKAPVLAGAKDIHCHIDTLQARDEQIVSWNWMRLGGSMSRVAAAVSGVAMLDSVVCHSSMLASTTRASGMLCCIDLLEELLLGIYQLVLFNLSSGRASRGPTLWRGSWSSHLISSHGARERDPIPPGHLTLSRAPPRQRDDEFSIVVATTYPTISLQRLCEIVLIHSLTTSP